MCVIHSKVLIAILVFLSAGCSTLSINAASNRIAQSAGFEKSFLKTKQFTLTAYYRFRDPGGKPLNIYIEGDGNAWLSCTHLSDNPTPRNPLVLELVSIDPSANVAYLARPGQYTESGMPLCDSAYWSDKRFSEEVIESIDEAITQLSEKSGTKDINLIGYSGGAAIAVLLAARRNDISSLRTIAGNLDTEAVNRYHQVSPLGASLNPIKVAKKIKNLPQRHFVGLQDKVVPYLIVESFVKMESNGCGNCITVVKGATHATGWRQRWRELLLIPPTACNN